MPTVSIDGITTRYEVTGSGPPLLMYSPGGFDATVEIAMHHVSASNERDGFAAVLEQEDSGVFQVTSENRAHTDVLAHPRHARSQGTDAANPDVNRHAGIARTVKSVDDLLVDH